MNNFLFIHSGPLGGYYHAVLDEFIDMIEDF